ncbi:MAG: hypothetical protein K2Y71_07315 [Xanthobacteraceae bacterium]|nr:hypothetical protein [Xanthobacteraceae bacterium]
MRRLLNKLDYLPSLRRRHLLSGNSTISHVSIHEFINRAIVFAMGPIVAATVLYPFVASPTPQLAGQWSGRASAEDPSCFPRKRIPSIELSGVPVVSIARNVDRPIKIIQVVIIVVGPLPAVGTTGRYARLIWVVAASVAIYKMTPPVGRGAAAAHEFVYCKSLEFRLNSARSGAPFVGTKWSSGKWIDRHNSVPSKRMSRLPS